MEQRYELLLKYIPDTGLLLDSGDCMENKTLRNRDEGGEDPDGHQLQHVSERK